MKTASSQCEETDTSTSKLATPQSIEKLPLPSGEDREQDVQLSKPYRMHNQLEYSLRILVISKFIISLSLV